MIDVSTDVHYELPVHVEMWIESVPLKNPKRDQEFPWVGLFIFSLRIQNASILFHLGVLCQAAYVIAILLPGSNVTLGVGR